MGAASLVASPAESAVGVELGVVDGAWVVGVDPVDCVDVTVGVLGVAVLGVAVLGV